MELTEILSQPEGFTPPNVTVTIEKVFPYKSGEGENGQWSFQDVKVNGGYLKLKGLGRALPDAHVGKTVTLRANQSKQHGLTGLKVLHEQHNGKSYDKLVVTSSAKWEWNGAATNGNKATSQNGHAPAQNGALDDATYSDHLLSCAELAAVIASHLSIDDPQALQACFATICIDTKNRGLLLPKPKTLPALSSTTSDGPDETPQDDPFGEDDIPF
jgi:hypothetical protein